MNETDKKWNEYIKYCLSKGQTQAQIKEELIKLNYHPRLADSVLREYNRTRKVKNKIIITSASIIILLLLSIALIKPAITGFVILDADEQSSVGTITLNFSQDIGTVNDYFYGVNTHGTWGSDGSMIDTNGDGNSDTLSDYEWHRTKLKEANITYIRADMNLENLIFGTQNKDAENWENNNITLVGGTKSVTGYPLGWDFEIVGAGSIGTVSKSTDAHSGQYSVNITNTGTQSAFSNLDLKLPKNHIYNLSVWIKSTYNISISLQREDTWSNACRTTSTGNNTWQQLTCIANITDDIPEGVRIVIETDSGENLLWDDLNLQQDNSDYDNFPDLSKQQSLVKWANENNMKVLFIASYMPNYLANITSDCSSNTMTCSANNYAEWGNNVVKYITEVTNEGLYKDSVEVEVWNEPDLDIFWLSNVGGTNAKRAQLYGQLYGATYNAIKSEYPDMPVGGPAVTGQDTDSELIHILEIPLNNIFTNLTSTSIENIKNREKLLKLEGGREAFLTREQKYGIHN